MNKLESVLENEMHKILWDFETQTNYLIPAPKPDFVLNNKKKKKLTAQLGVKIKESKKIVKYLDIARGLKRLWNMRWRWYQL